ncbi:MAG: UDP-glucose 4-epimerase GalE [Candidatus Nanopelagicaceae bacterium]|nr:UDP-glucose 4-epimerase GalE [Candidatus Nanopelagicaceae bacterium]
MSKVLVTGGAGYIGAHVAAELLKAGYSVRIYDDFSNGLHKRVDGNFRDIVEGDILDREKLIQAMHGVDAVIHLAAKKAVEESVKNPLKYYENNVGGTLNLLAAMSLKGVKKIVFSSSAAVYSPNDKDAVEETDPTVPLSPYGATKLLSEELITTVGNAEQISHISLRYFNVVGASIPAFGDNSKDNLVPKVFLALKAGKRPQIYGTDYPTPDGTCIRDYIHVQDLALAHVAALKKTESDFVSSVYNVGSGNGYSVREMMNQISQTLGRDINPEESPARAGDSPKLIASTAKIEKELGWKPTATLKEMIDSSWAAESSN